MPEPGKLTDMHKEEALAALDGHEEMDPKQRELAIVNALEHGWSEQDVATRVGMTVDELMQAHGLAVRNAGTLGSFKAPGEAPRIVDLEK